VKREEREIREKRKEIMEKGRRESGGRGRKRGLVLWRSTIFFFFFGFTYKHKFVSLF
jgi:hypothetical protein